jgi:cobalt-zinc-cadmium resistance protein CzcA
VAQLSSPAEAARRLRRAEQDRVRELRGIAVTAVNNVPVRVRDLAARDPEGGVAVTAQPRLGRVSLSRPKQGADGQPVLDADGQRLWDDFEERVQGVVLMRKGEATRQALAGAKQKMDELNQPGRLLPGVQVEAHFDLTGLLHRTTQTVRRNLAEGMVLVTLVLLMFLGNVRTALIVALNIPLALLFAFSVLFLRGKSANLLSIGAVDFGIIVDSTVIVVENIFRHATTGSPITAAGRSVASFRERILIACGEVEKPLFFSTVIMVVALLPLLTMTGPEGQIFGPMADTYAFALAGALLLALTVSPVLCLLFLRNLKPARDNILVRGLKRLALWNLDLCLNHRGLALGVVGFLLAATAAALPFLGREFMPELEEGNIYIRGTFPVNISLDEVAARARAARAIIRQYPEVALAASQLGRPDDGTDPTGFYNAEFSVPLIPEEEWPALVEQTGWKAWLYGPNGRAPRRSWSRR